MTMNTVDLSPKNRRVQGWTSRSEVRTGGPGGPPSADVLGMMESTAQSQVSQEAAGQVLSTPTRFLSKVSLILLVLWPSNTQTQHLLRFKQPRFKPQLIGHGHASIRPGFKTPHGTRFTAVWGGLSRGEVFLRVQVQVGIATRPSGHPLLRPLRLLSRRRRSTYPERRKPGRPFVIVFVTYPVRPSAAPAAVPPRRSEKKGTVRGAEGTPRRTARSRARRTGGLWPPGRR